MCLKCFVKASALLLWCQCVYIHEKDSLNLYTMANTKANILQDRKNAPVHKCLYFYV